MELKLVILDDIERIVHFFRCDKNDHLKVHTKWGTNEMIAYLGFVSNNQVGAGEEEGKAGLAA